MGVFWIRKLPDDTDRAALVPNLFLGAWATFQAIGAMCGASWSCMFYLIFGSLLLLGSVAIFIAAHLSRSQGRWGSVELISWTLNVGATGVAIATGALLMRLSIEHPAYELAGWVPFGCVAVVLGFLGISFG